MPLEIHLRPFYILVTMPIRARLQDVHSFADILHETLKQFPLNSTPVVFDCTRSIQIHPKAVEEIIRQTTNRYAVMVGTCAHQCNSGLDVLPNLEAVDDFFKDGFTFSYVVNGNNGIVRLGGKLSGYNAQNVREVLLSKIYLTPKLIIVLKNVTYVDRKAVKFIEGIHAKGLKKVYVDIPDNYLDLFPINDEIDTIITAPNITLAKELLAGY